MKTKKQVVIALMLAVSATLSAQFNQFRFYYANVPQTPAATITASSITIPYKLQVTNQNVQSPMIASGGIIGVHVFLTNANGNYHVGEFHHAYNYNFSTYGFTPAGYPSTLSYIPANTATFPNSYGTTTQTATIPISTACIPNGTYTVRLEINHIGLSCEVPDGATPVSFIVNGSTSNPAAVAFPSNQYDVYAGKFGGGNLGSVTISGSSSTFAPTASTTLGSCTAFGSVTVTAAGGTAPYVLQYRKVTSNNNLGAITTVNASTSPITVNGISPGNYDFYLTDANGCKWYKQVVMAASPAPAITITPGAQTLSVGTCVGFNATASSGTGYTYDWKRSHATESPNTVATTAYTCQTLPLPGGSTRYRPVNYQVTMTNAYCSGSATRTMQVDSWYINTSGNGCCAPASRAGEFGQNEQTAATVSVFPNPASNLLNVTFDPAGHTNIIVEIMDVNGKVVQSQVVTDGINKAELDVSSLAKGIYVVRVISTEGLLDSQSFVRE
ncbi:MAG: T9SS type A sorting domain-containing protein [Bacteroidetes bacterium]|nr:T9SS type A sorting domain-containing protein [Bacteroidota bacterium]